jgi:hypothetical protein
MVEKAQACGAQIAGGGCADLRRGGRAGNFLNVCANLARPTPRARPCLHAHKPTWPSAAAHSRARPCSYRFALFSRAPQPCPMPPRTRARATAAAARGTRIPLAGGDAAGNPTETLLSEVGLVLLRFFDTREACVLRLVCREFVEAVRVQHWEDRETVIKGSIAAWRACFPRARCANVKKIQFWSIKEIKRSAPVVDADFVHFEGLRELNMAGCTDVTDAAFAHLRGIHTLDMSHCNQPAITSAAFAHLVGIQRLSTWGCNQATLSDAAFVHLRGIQLLNMSYCTQLTDAAFVHLRGIHTLYMWDCNQPAISDAALAHLRGIHTLVIEGCNQATLTGAGFAHLRGIRTLGMHDCRADQVAAARGLGLPVNTRGCTSIEALHYTFDERGWGE